MLKCASTSCGSSAHTVCLDFRDHFVFDSFDHTIRRHDPANDEKEDRPGKASARESLGEL